MSMIRILNVYRDAFHVEKSAFHEIQVIICLHGPIDQMVY